MDYNSAMSKPLVMVGLSGGVDSAVAAHLLLRDGYRVAALHMTNWEEDAKYCTSAQDLQDARRVCDALGITLHRVNFAERYRRQVFDYFLKEYQAGRTPNPDVLCYREIKFGVFRDYARRLGAHRIATGHYARLITVDGQTRLLKGIDINKDQSYFLHAVSERQLDNALFPLGELTKPQVREIARDLGMPVHDKRDSTGICFIGERPFREFLKQYLPAQPGDMVTADGTVVGRHEGLMYYTLGQRQGLGIGGRTGATQAPWYVAGKNLGTNQLVVVQGHDHPLLLRNSLETSEPHWINGMPELLDQGTLQCTAKTRYRQPDRPCSVQASPTGLRVQFEQPQWAVTPGQYLVLYQGDRCLGGAAIQSPTAREVAQLAAAV